MTLSRICKIKNRCCLYALELISSVIYFPTCLLCCSGKNNIVLATELLKFIENLMFLVENSLKKCEVFETLESNSYNCGRMSVFQYYVNGRHSMYKNYDFFFRKQ